MSIIKIILHYTRIKCLLISASVISRNNKNRATVRTAQLFLTRKKKNSKDRADFAVDNLPHGASTGDKRRQGNFVVRFCACCDCAFGKAHPLSVKYSQESPFKRYRESPASWYPLRLHLATSSLEKRAAAAA